MQEDKEKAAVAANDAAEQEKSLETTASGENQPASETHVPEAVHEDDADAIYKKKLFWGGVSIVAALMFVFGFNAAVKPDLTDTATKQAAETVTAGKNGGTFMEDNTGSDNMTEVAEKVSEDMEEFNEKIDKPEKTSGIADTLGIGGKEYYLFDGDMLLPVSQDEWQEYVVPQAKDGAYEKISEFYLTDESPSNWTQKFTVHKAASIEDDSFAFMEKLVNGIIVNISDRMALQNRELTADDIAVNYVSKDGSNATMYWGLRKANEVQFVRVFKAEQTGETYVATASYKANVDAIDEEFAAERLAVLDSMQQLKRRGE